MSEVVITVRGEHERRILPERAIAHLTITTEGPERGAVVERIAALTEPVRDDLIARKDAGGLTEWTSKGASVWTDRPWSPEGKRLAPVHHASVELTATFADFAALSWWASDVVEREGVQFGWIDWQLTPETRSALEKDVATEAVRVAVARATAYADAIGLASVTPLEIADLGLLTHGSGGQDAAPAPMMLAKAMRAEAFDMGSGGGPTVDFQPEEMTVTAAVEARFAAR